MALGLKRISRLPRLGLALRTGGVPELIVIDGVLARLITDPVDGAYLVDRDGSPLYGPV